MHNYASFVAVTLSFLYCSVIFFFLKKKILCAVCHLFPRYTSLDLLAHLCMVNLVIRIVTCSMNKRQLPGLMLRHVGFLVCLIQNETFLVIDFWTSLMPNWIGFLSVSKIERERSNWNLLAMRYCCHCTNLNMMHCEWFFASRIPFLRSDLMSFWSLKIPVDCDFLSCKVLDFTWN